MATPRLYHDDPLLLAFTATVLGHGELGGRRTVILDRTAFYPESGGQMADRGRLAGLPIADVQVDDAGVVHHVLEGELPPVGTLVPGEIDRARRRLHMALHTGQHMLSRALADVARAETVSSRLGETVCTVDLDGRAPDERQLAAAEEMVNAVIEDDVAIRAFFPTADELRALPLRRAPKVSEDIRVIAIGDFDVSPCGGTHCTRSAQVGLVKITGVERYKGKLRVSFSAGRRARSELRGDHETLRALARELTCGPADVPGALERLRRELALVRDAEKRASARLAEAAAADLAARAAASGRPQAIAAFDDASIDFLRTVASRVT